MELKLRRDVAFDYRFPGSNRTFMELKLYNQVINFFIIFVLIVPLWN